MILGKKHGTSYLPCTYLQNAPMNHEMSDTAKKQYKLLLDVIDLCAIYY